MIDDSGGPGMRHLGLRAWARPAAGGGTVSSGPAAGQQVASAEAGHPGRGMGRAGLEVVFACAAFVVLCVAVLSVAAAVVAMFGLGIWSFHTMLSPQNPGPAPPPHCNIGQPHCPS